jgi:hypothetical protein
VSATKNHACAVCARRFRTEHGLNDHARDSHGAPAVFQPKAKHLPKVEPKCIECGKLATLVCGESIYPHRPDLFSKRFYLCECGAYCGCHPNTIVPLGFPCGAETRRARSAAHAAFDPLWKRGSMARRDAYQWLASLLGIDPEDCHIGMMDAETARRIPALVANLTKAAA